MPTIDDGTGKGKAAEVDGRHRLKTRAVSETATQAANDLGDAYNINTGTVTISATTALIYYKNTGANDFVLDAIALGVGAGTFDGSLTLTVIRNPTTGTIIDGGAAVDMNQNRNFSSTQSLSADIFKGASGNTFTNGADIAQFFTSGQGRLFATVDFVIPQGASFGLRLDPNLTSGSVDVYAALIGHERDSVE